MNKARIVDLKELGVDVDTFDIIYKMGEEDGREDAVDEFVEMFIAEGQKRKYLRHIWIEQTCKKIAEQLKEK